MKSEMTEFEDLTQFEPHTKRFRRIYAGCHICKPITQIQLKKEMITAWKWINQLIISITLLRL